MGSERIEEERIGKEAREPVPETFDGSGPWEEFMFQFLWRSIAHHWSDTEKVGHLVDLLRGQALSIICVLGDSVLTFNEVVEALEKRYSCRGQEQHFMCRLRKRRQEPGESLTSFGVDLEILVRRALPGVSSDVIETVALQRFYDGIQDPAIREAVVDSPSTSLCEALSAALRVEGRLARANVLPKIIGRRAGVTSYRRSQRRMPYSKLKCSKCGEQGHLRGRCPWRDRYNRSSTNNVNIRQMSTVRSISLPEAVIEGIEYGVIARSQHTSAPDSVGVSSYEDNIRTKMGNSGDESDH